MIAFGAAFAGPHRVEIEAGFFRSDVKRSDFTMDFIPVVLNYKYSLPVAERWTVHAGVTAGAVYQKPRFSYGMEGKTKSGETFGVNAGASFSLNERLSLEGAAKVLRINETRYTTAGNVVLLQLGLNVRL